jgi:hypothetical protein
MTTYLQLTATPQPKPSSGVALNRSALLAAGALGGATGVEFVNSSREVLSIQQGTAATNFTVVIGTTVEGEPVTSITYTGIASAIQEIGPFNSDFDVEPGGWIQVTFATAANITGVVLVQNSGAV